MSTGSEGRSLSVLSMSEALEKLDRVHVFQLTRLLPDGSRDLAPEPHQGHLHFFTDATEATTKLSLASTLDPTARLRLELVGLGRVFALMQGLMGLKPPAPVVLQFARQVVEAEGERGVPPPLRERMRGQGPFPLFYSEAIGSPLVTPVFFSRDDLLQHWTKNGGESLPEVTVTDLRVVVARMLQEPGEWKPLVFIPPRASAELVRTLSERADKEAAITQGFVRGAKLLAKVEHEIAKAEGDVPPPLTATDEANK